MLSVSHLWPYRMCRICDLALQLVPAVRACFAFDLLETVQPARMPLLSHCWSSRADRVLHGMLIASERLSTTGPHVCCCFTDALLCPCCCPCGDHVRRGVTTLHTWASLLCVTCNGTDTDPARTGQSTTPLAAPLPAGAALVLDNGTHIFTWFKPTPAGRDPDPQHQEQCNQVVQRLLADRVPVPAVRHIQAVGALWCTVHTQPHALD